MNVTKESQSKLPSQTFFRLADEREKQQSFSRRVAAMRVLDMSHGAGPESSPLEGNDLLVQILPLFDPVGSSSRSGGDARLPKCVFAILRLPFLPLSLASA